MKAFSFFAILAVIAAAALGGWYLGRHNPSQSAPDAGGRKVLFYQSAMHPWIKSDQPGNCTICGMKLTPVYEGDQPIGADPGIITLNSNSITAINVQTTPVERRPLTRTLNVAGRIEVDQTRSRVISAYVDGRVERLFVNYTGAEVEQGEPLALLYSPALLTAEREYLAILGQAALTNSVQLSGERDLLIASASERLRRLGLRDDQIAALPSKSETNYTTEITAPISGTVLTRNVVEGQYVKEGEKLFELADLSRLWFVFDVYEQDLAWAKPGAKVLISSPALPGKTYEGAISFIEPTLNEATRSARARVELANPLIEGTGPARRELYNNLFGDGRIVLPSGPVLAVPRTAVIHPGDTPRVYVERSEGAYERREVLLGQTTEDFVEILAGLADGERVVTTGNLLIDAQAQISSPAATPAHDHRADEHSSGQVTAIPAAESEAVRYFLERVASLNQVLAADDLEAAKAALAQAKDASAHLLEAIGSVEELAAARESLVAALPELDSSSLDALRKSYIDFSKATVDLAGALRGQESGTSIKTFKCPMYPAPGKTAYWVQRDLPIRNPFYGAEMLDCGTEVK